MKTRAQRLARHRVCSLILPFVRVSSLSVHPEFSSGNAPVPAIFPFANSSRTRRARRGGVLLSALMFTVISSLLVLGAITTSLSYYSRAKTEADYEQALALAEAGVNYELRKISVDSGSADQVSTRSPGGGQYSLGGGTYTVYCSNRDGSTPWTAPSDLYVVSAGTVNGVTRTVKVAVKGGGSSSFAVYAVKQGTLSGNGSIDGSVGTDGHLAASGSASIDGAVEFDGPNTGWNGSFPTGSPITTKPSPIVWPTVSECAERELGCGGLTRAATENDNCLSSCISNNKLIVSGNGSATLCGKPGGANYYLTDIDVSGSGSVTFDNRNGPITIWMGPVGGSGRSAFSGGSAIVKADSTKEVKIYSALKTTFAISGGSEYDGGLYVYDVYNGSAIGTVDHSGGSNVAGTILANTITVSGGSSVNSTISYFDSGSTGYYGLDNQWQEINPL